MNLTVQNNEILKSHSTLQVGGEAEYFVEITSEEDLAEAVAYATENTLAITVLGDGSNVLISEEGIKGFVLHMGLKGIQTETSETQVYLTAGAGELLDEVVSFSVENGYWGLENLSHIPGTVGAAPIQNVGAYGVEAKEVIHSVRVFNVETRVFEVLTPEQCCFGYRDSLFKSHEGRKYIVVSVSFLLTIEESPRLSYRDLQNRFKNKAPSIQEVRDAVIDIRSAKFPDWSVVGTAGSFFKNPIVSRVKFEELQGVYPELPGFDVDGNFVKIPLGWILDKVLHLKGEGTEKVGTYQGQALVLINKGAATADDFVSFATEVTKKVKDATGIDVQWEVTKMGF